MDRCWLVNLDSWKEVLHLFKSDYYMAWPVLWQFGSELKPRVIRDESLMVHCLATPCKAAVVGQCIPGRECELGAVPTAEEER